MWLETAAHADPGDRVITDVDDAVFAALGFMLVGGWGEPPGVSNYTPPDLYAVVFEGELMGEHMYHVWVEGLTAVHGGKLHFAEYTGALPNVIAFAEAERGVPNVGVRKYENLRFEADVSVVP